MDLKAVSNWIEIYIKINLLLDKNIISINMSIIFISI